jgi:hypothetical protein
MAQDPSPPIKNKSCHTRVSSSHLMLNRDADCEPEDSLPKETAAEKAAK